MGNSKAWWLQVVDAVDGVARPVLEGAVRHDAFAIGLTVVRRGRQAVESRAERLSRHVLHGLNLPTATDQNRLLIQVAAVEHRVRELGKGIDDARLAEAREVQQRGIEFGKSLRQDQP